MKAIPLFVSLALALARMASGQAYGEAIQLNQPAVRSTGSAVSVPAGAFGMPTGQPQQGGVQVVNDMYRGLSDCRCAESPNFSPGPAEVTPNTQITLSSPSPDATIYFTSDGWTPTESSKRYIGPITITANTRLQAFAVEPQKLPSPVVAATYEVTGAADPPPTSVMAFGKILVKGTELRLVTCSKVSSETAKVGDRVPLLLDQDLMVGSDVVAPRGMSADGEITKVEQAGKGGKSGLLVFNLRSFDARGISIRLNGVFTLIAPDIAGQMQKISNPSMVHIAEPLPVGNEAEIVPGMTLTAAVATDTELRH
jgi:hypothetical protein